MINNLHQPLELADSQVITNQLVCASSAGAFIVTGCSLQAWGALGKKVGLTFLKVYLTCMWPATILDTSGGALAIAAIAMAHHYH